MGRNRFVGMKVDRLFLADVHKTALQKLRTDGAADRGKTRAATAEELRAAEQTVAAAVADGDWIDVKHELNAGEARRAWARTVKQFHMGDRAELDPEQVGLSRLVEYIVGWSFVDAAGQPVPYEPAALDNLDVDTIGEIREAIDAHEARVAADAEAQQAKNLTGAIG